MTQIIPSQNENKRSIVTLFIGFMIMTTVLFVGMTLAILIPKLDKTFDDMRSEADKTTTQVFAGQLHQYIHDRELALNDIATNALVTNTILLDNGKNATFRDFINNTTLLGEDPLLTVVNVIGEVLYTEEDDALIKNSYQWALPLLNDQSLSNPVNTALLTIASTTPPQFKIAVPILYGQRAQGILIARITADPDELFKEDGKFDANSGIAYEKNNQRIASSINNFNIIHKELVNIDRYGLAFSYISDRTPVIEKKKAITDSFLLTTLFGSLVLLTTLYLFGKRIIVKPFEALAASEASIASAVEGISHIDTYGCYITLNQAYAGAAGYTPNELEGQPWTKTVYPEDLASLEVAYQKMIDDGKVTAEARGIKKDGTIFYKRVTMISRYNNEGIFIGHDCFMQDISAQKHTEEKIRKQQQDLQLIFDNVPVKIWYKDDKNRILRLNKNAATSMGGTVEDFEGKDTYDLFPDMAKKYHEDDLSVIQSEKPLLNIIEEYTPIHGPRGWVSTDKIPHTDPVSEESFLFVCSQDITSLKNVEMEKNQLIEKLSHTNKELEQFAYIASHDLKAPLRGIEQLAGWIEDDCSAVLPEQSLNHLNLMKNRVKRMGNLLDDLLAYSHVNRIDLSQENINIKDLLSNLVDLHIQPAGFKHELKVPNGTILIARKPFEIVIRNLLDNAVKHHHQGNGTITIEYNSSNHAHYINVTDDGPGIAPELHEKVFKMFQTLQPRDKTEGSGMGLAIISKILKRYDGSITIDSDGNSGTTFKIEWPHNQIKQEG